MAYTLRQLIDMIRTVSDSQTVLRQLYDMVESINTSTNPPQVIETTDNLHEGSINLYFTNDRVRNTLLNGLSTTDYSNVLYSDSILTAIGKLQARNNQQGTSTTYNVGTSGATIPLLSTANTWSLVQTFSGGIVGDVTGTASNASKVANALTINGVAYDGSIARSFALVTSAQVGAASGVAPLDSSSKLAVTYLPTSGATAGTYKSVTVDTYGRVTAGTNPTTLSGYGITDAIPASQKGAASGVAALDASSLLDLNNVPKISGGGFSGLKISTLGLTNFTSIITANSVAVLNSIGQVRVLSSVSVSPVISASGANGLDTGALAASTWYHVFVIYNPTTQTIAGLFSLSATAPTLPSGYTFFARVGAVCTDSTANKYLLQTLQYGRQVQYVATTSSNVPYLPVMSAGVLGTYSSSAPTYAAVSTSSFVPPTASIIRLKLQGWYGSAGAYIGVVPNSSYSGSNSTSPPVLAIDSTGSNTGVTGELILESANIYVYSSTSGGRLQCLGWEDNL